MMPLFVARRCAAESLADLNAFVVVLAESERPDADRLELQTALELEEQDRELGMDTYCVCRASGATHYGGVVSWSLSEDALVLGFSSDAARVLDLPSEVVLSLELDARALTDLRAGLIRVLGSEPT